MKLSTIVPVTRGRRWALIAAIVLAVVGAGGLGATLQLRWKLEKLRSQGIEAVEKRDLPSGLKQLGEYLTHRPDDAEALLYFSRAREAVLASANGHTRSAIASWRRYCSLQPTDPAGWLALSRNLSLGGSPEDAAFAARRALRLRPRDLEARQLLVAALMRRSQFEEASNELNAGMELHPDAWQFVSLKAVCDAASGVPINEIIACARAVAERYSDDARFLGVLAATLRVCGQPDQAETAFRDAVARASADVEYLRWLVQALDESGLSRLTVDLLKRNSSVLADRGLALIFARCCWEQNRRSLIVEYLAAKSPTVATDPELTLLVALALRNCGRAKECETLVAAQMLTPPNDAQQRWLRLLDLARKSEECDPRDLLSASRDALEITPRVPLLFVMQAEAWMKLGEYRLSTQAARKAAALASGWDTPRLLEALGLLRNRQPEQAVAVAFRALKINPLGADSALALSIGWFDCLDVQNLEATSLLLRWLIHLEQTVSGEMSVQIRTLRIQVLIKSGHRDEALALFRELVDDKVTSRSLSESELVALQRIVAEPSAGPSGASSEIVKTPAENPLLGSLEIPQIEQLEAESPEGATTWRLLKARALLANSRTEKSAATAALLLRPVLDRISDHPDAHLLAAAALSRLRNYRQATEHLHSLVSSDPRRCDDALRLALTFRADDGWTDADDLVSSWVSLTRVEYSRDAPSSRRITRDATDTADSGGQRATVVRLLVLAEYAERVNDRSLAESTYRMLLRIDPAQHVACNNLAVLLMTNESCLLEALRLAQRAVDLAPDVAEYAETLRQVRDAAHKVEHETLSDT